MNKEIENRINAMFEELVPASGKADTVAGEIVRAACRIGYRWCNDGDMVGVGYGKETCNPAARYLGTKADDAVAATIKDIWGMYLSDDEYERRLDRVLEAVLNYLEGNPELREQENTEDMFDYYDKYEDVDDEEEEEEDYYEEEEEEEDYWDEDCEEE